MSISKSGIGRWVSLGLAASLLTAIPPSPLLLRAQGKAARTKENPAEALAETLTAACRRDEPAFANHLTSETAAVFQKLPESQRGRLMGRLALLDAAGRPLLSTSAEGHPVVRCDAQGAITELRFGATDTQENLAFVTVEAHAAGASRTIRFGLVREGGQWRLISVGLLLLDLPTMQQEWVEADVRASEVAAVAALHKIAEALKAYQEGFDQLPEGLDQLGPAPKDGVSPDRAGLLDAALAAGKSGDYLFRYSIVPAGGSGTEAERDKAAGFALAATPQHYRQPGL
jgi:hypothetical protein